MDYFELFGLDESLLVDQKAVLQRYFDLCKAWHPDKFTLADEQSKEKALEMTAEINQGKLMLSDAQRRLEYLLQKKGVIEAGEKHQLSPEFLGEMMEINEALLELSFEEDELKKDAISKEVDQYIKKEYATVASLFDASSFAPSQTEYDDLKNYYYRRKYLKRIIEKLD